ncbi:MAG TPA: hypothetical protein VFP91_05155 [Vicinamibacterales bacterium]|nr:hypothetical protein [Vicinamibacterales bacterium]
MTSPIRRTWIVLAICLMAAGRVGAQGTSSDDESEALAKKLSNPISDLVSVPFQFNWEQKVGPLELSQFVLNVQPVIPFTLNPDWNLILRVIVPFVGQPPFFPGDLGEFGIGDMTTSFFFSPQSKGGFTVGFGPAVVTPQSYQPTISSGKYSIGPTAVALNQSGKSTIGVLWNQVWSFAGDPRRRSVNQMFLQPFFAYQATKTITLTVQSETTADWNATTDNWTVPINFLISKLSSFGVFPASYQFGAGVYPVHPSLGPQWKIRANIVILLPRKK